MDLSCMSCADCAVKNCTNGKGEYPEFCPTTNKMDPEFISEIMARYKEPDNKKIMDAAAAVEYEFYCKYTRIEETMEFAKKIGAKKIGIATCVALLAETRTIAKVFRHNGFEVFGIACKSGAQPKASLGLPKEHCEIGPNICNPILQAEMLNKEGTELNVVVGLCVGHDSMFYKYSKAPTTTLIVKDRVLGHNPVAAIYTSETVYKKKLYK